MSYSDVLDLNKLDDGVAVMKLNRPASRNALSDVLRKDIAECLKSLETDTNIKAVVLTGAGDIFCAGFDLKELRQGDASSIFAEARGYHRAVY